jgi:hypothetical protein
MKKHYEVTITKDNEAVGICNFTFESDETSGKLVLTSSSSQMIKAVESEQSQRFDIPASGTEFEFKEWLSESLCRHGLSCKIEEKKPAEPNFSDNYMAC